ncbi:MAG: hypothetical protein RLZZ45_1134 [Bacteroidota bacterium]
MSYCETEEDSKNIIDYCYNTTIQILDQNWLFVRILANELLKRNTMSFNEVDAVLKDSKFKNLTDLKNSTNYLY